MSDNSDPTHMNGQASLKDRVRELQLTNRLDAGKPVKSGSSTSWLPWFLCIAMALVWAGVGIRSYRQKGPAVPTVATTPSSERPKDAARAASAESELTGSGAVVLESKGYLIPSHSISVSPIDVAGRVTVLNIEEGRTFQQGDLLAMIDATRFLADQQEAKAQVEASQSRLQEMESSTKLEIQQAEFELAEAQAQKADALLVYNTTRKTASGAIADLEIKQAGTKFDATSEHVKALEKKLEIIGKPRDQRILAAKGDLQAAQARLAKTQWALDNCSIKSPVTGVILTKKAEVGSLINPVVGGVSTSLCEIADLSQIEVDLEIQERDIAKLRDDMACRIRTDAFPDRTYEGYLDRSMPIANRARGIIPVRVKVILPPDEKQGRYLKPEMGVSVTFVDQQFPFSKMVLPNAWRGVQNGATLATRTSAFR